jgi:hypothetical protein
MFSWYSSLASCVCVVDEGRREVRGGAGSVCEMEGGKGEVGRGAGEVVGGW